MSDVKDGGSGGRLKAVWPGLFMKINPSRDCSRACQKQQKVLTGVRAMIVNEGSNNLFVAVTAHVQK
jgi:hypothetical protein